MILERQTGAGNYNGSSCVPPLKSVLHPFRILVLAIFKHFDDAVVEFIMVKEPIFDSPIGDGRDCMTILLQVIDYQIEVAAKTHLNACICD